MKKIILLLILASCSAKSIESKSNNSLLDFNIDLNFDEFKSLLDKYNNINEYPDINS